MGIFSRMSDIINSNINAMLDQAEDPAKMVRLIIQEMEDTLVEVRTSSARVLAERKQATRRLEQARAEAETWEEKARLAISRQREDLARGALQEKRSIDEEVALVEAELIAADEHIKQLSTEVLQLQQKLDDARARQKALSLRTQTVQSRIKVKRQIQRDALDDAFCALSALNAGWIHWRASWRPWTLGVMCPRTSLRRLMCSQATSESVMISRD